MADRTNMVHVQAANGMWVWVPTSELEAWKKKQDKIRAGLSPEEEQERKAKIAEELRELSELREARRRNTES